MAQKKKKTAKVPIKTNYVLRKNNAANIGRPALMNNAAVIKIKVRKK